MFMPVSAWVTAAPPRMSMAHTMTAGGRGEGGQASAAPVKRLGQGAAVRGRGARLQWG